MTNAKAVPGKDRFIIVGQLGKTYGVFGWVKVNSFTNPIENVLDYEPWFYQQKNQWIELPVNDAQSQGNSIVAHIEGYDTPEAARALTGIEIAVQRSQLPALAKDEFFWCDLVGLNVITTNGIELGTVSRLFYTGANDILVVQGNKEHLIPYIKDHFVLKVDIPKQTMIVDWDPEF
jgi:16S rRNA processing protein RimM